MLLRRLLSPSSSISLIQTRGVRSQIRIKSRPTYPFFFKSKGWREEGPYYWQLWEWPEKDSGWSQIPPIFPRQPEPRFRDDAKSQKVGFHDARTNRYTEIDEAKPELIVPPDLDEFKLKPYVSFRCLESESDAPELTSKDLFDIFYSERVEESYRQGKYDGDDGQTSRGTIFTEELELDGETRRLRLVEKGLPFVDDGNSIKPTNKPSLQ